MSSQSIKETNKNDLLLSLDKALISMGNNFMLKERFGFNKDVSMSDYRKIKRYSGILCRLDCLNEDTLKLIASKVKKITGIYG